MLGGQHSPEDEGWSGPPGGGHGKTAGARAGGWKAWPVLCKGRYWRTQAYSVQIILEFRPKSRDQDRGNQEASVGPALDLGENPAGQLTG